MNEMKLLCYYFKNAVRWLVISVSQEHMIYYRLEDYQLQFSVFVQLNFKLQLKFNSERDKLIVFN